MKIKVSSKGISIGISFLVFLAVGILAVAFIGKGTAENNISFEVYSDIEYSEHEGWTDISDVFDTSDASGYEDVSGESVSEASTEEIMPSADEVAKNVNLKYECGETLSDLQFSDETGIQINKISFLDGYTPENVFCSLGYVFAGDKVFDLQGNDLTETFNGYSFVGGRNGDGKVLFEKDGKYFYFENGIFSKTENINYIMCAPAYMCQFDDNYPLLKNNSGWGAANSEGKTIIKNSYTYGYGFNEGVGIFASKTKKLYLYNTSGKLITSNYVAPEGEMGGYRIQNGITLASDGKKDIILKATGAVLETPKDYKVLGCSDGMILLEKNGKTGYMNQNGFWVTTPTFDSSSFYHEGLAVVHQNGVFVIDRNGETIIPKGFDFISSFTEGCSILYSNEYGWYMAKKLLLK